VAAAVGTIPGVTSAESVTGPYDVVVRAEGRSLAEISSRVVGAIHLVEGVTRTLTCPAVGVDRSHG
jgi:DNA-binding Lrp family transcriptional regulator